MKYITEIREKENDKFIDFLYFENEDDADYYMKECNNQCFKRNIPLISKGRKVNQFKKERLKEQALSKLTEEEKKILGL